MSDNSVSPFKIQKILELRRTALALTGKCHLLSYKQFDQKGLAGEKLPALILCANSPQSKGPWGQDKGGKNSDHKGKDKGKGKGDTKGYGKQGYGAVQVWNQSWHTHTNDDPPRPVCKRWHTTGCTAAQCNFAHNFCPVPTAAGTPCGGQHKAINCPAAGIRRNRT